MTKYQVEIYVEGVEVLLSWHDEREYWLGRKFLAGFDDFPETQRRRDPYYVEWYSVTKEQFEKLLDFRKELRERREGR